jgi:hypothetical protein
MGVDATIGQGLSTNPPYQQERGMVTYTVLLTTGVWTKVTGQSNRRVSIHMQPTSSQIAIAFGQNAPTALPTQINDHPFTPNVINHGFSPAMIKETIWAFTLAAGVSLIVTEELTH